MKATQTIALSALLALLLTTGPAQARDWRWYPRKSPADSGALRPDLEGTRNDETDTSGSGELEEMRQWLQQRDEDRRQQGITIPDTVEQLEPAEDFTAPRRRWPEQDERDPTADASSNDRLHGSPAWDEQNQRVRDTLFPRSYGKRHSHFSRRSWRHASSASSRRSARHPASGGNRRHGYSRHHR